MKTGSRVVTGFLIVLSLIMISCFEGDDIPDFNEQLQKDIAAIDSHLSANNISDVIVDNSGIRYVIHRRTTGKRATIDSCATVNYKGLLMTGEKFDEGANFSFPVRGVIEGWRIGISLLHEGDSVTFYIPSVYAYGYEGMPPEIPRNANLIFHVGLTNVGTTYRGSDDTCLSNDNTLNYWEQLEADISAIDSYLTENNISAVQDASGIRYIIHRDGEGNKPTIDSCVTTDYRGEFLTDGQGFDEGSNVSFPLSGVIEGWKIGIPLLSEGDSATLYIPSGLGYGYYGYPPEIPGNANLIFHVAIKKVGQTYNSSDRSCN
jgi:FKBP-type peptidyl-prolyl cis-trans isomerase